MEKGDFIELDYTGKTQDQKEVFDTTSEDVAKKEGIYSDKTKYGPVKVVLGEGHILPGLETRLIGKEIGKYSFEIPDKEAFGKKDASKLKLMPAKAFKHEQIRPFPGLQINVDGEIGTVKSVSGGRIIVDFNHPLSSRDVEYEVNIKKIIKDTQEKVEALFELFKLPYEEIKLEGEKLTVKTKIEFPAQLTGSLTDDIKRLIKLKEIKFEKI